MFFPSLCSLLLCPVVNRQQIHMGLQQLQFLPPGHKAEGETKASFRAGMKRSQVHLEEGQVDDLRDPVRCLTFDLGFYTLAHFWGLVSLLPNSSFV